MRAAALRVEVMKFLRSPVTWTASVLMAVFVPALALGFSWVAENGAGVIAAKAQTMVVGEGWDGYLSLAGQTAAAAVFVGAGVIVAWTFGREHADRTFPSLFALPVSRGAVAAAKLAVLVGWGAVMSVAVAGMALTLGVASGLPTPPGTGWMELGRLGVVVLLTCLLATTVGFVTSVGRGYLPGIGAVVVLVATAQVAVFFGAGGWFPFAVPGLLAVAGTGQLPLPTWTQLALVPVTVCFFGWLTVRWWSAAEVA